MKGQQQAFRSPNFLTDSEVDIARWLMQQEAEEGVKQITSILQPTSVERRFGHVMLVYLILFPVMMIIAQYLEVRFSVLFALVGSIPGVAGLINFMKSPRARLTERRQKWLRHQLMVHLERGGRSIPLAVWIDGVQALGGERRKVYELLARRLATATTEELQALSQDERRWLRARLKDEWPGEALQTALLLALGTAGDIFAKPYARRLVRNPDESETVREAAEECLRSLERTG